MIRLTGFGDEVGPDLGQQMDVLGAEGVKFIELRAANNKNVMTFTKDECKEFKKKLDDRDFGISAIGSPIGKVKVTEEFEKTLDSLKHAIELAKFFESDYIRLFTFYPPDGEDINKYRDEVIKRMSRETEVAKDAGVVLLSENESSLYAESPENHADVIRTVNSPYLQGVFDPANFILKGYKPYDRCWPLLKDITTYFHIKDAKIGVGESKMVPAGQGDGQIPQVLSDAVKSGFSGFVSLEPHLSKGGKFSGFSGPELFTDAIRALKKILNQVGAKY